MLSLRLLGMLVLVLPPRLSIGQSEGFRDDFSDGDFTANPEWFGDAERWTVVPYGDGYALRSDGEARQDTITLATASEASFGSWSFFFRHENISLSNFNGARIYLVADQPDLRGHINGYYVQMGTNNLRRVELWRQDGPSTNRTRLAESASDFLPGTENDVRIRVERSPHNEWSVWANDQLLFSVFDDRHPLSRYFGIWVRHSTAAARSFYFDDFDVDGVAYVDVTPPEPLDARTSNDGMRVSVRWSEPLDPVTVTPQAFLIDNHIRPFQTDYREDETGVRTVLHMDEGLAPGVFSLTFTGIADTSGNVVLPGTELLVRHEPDLEPPYPISVDVRSELHLAVRFSESLGHQSAARPEHYELLPARGHPVTVDHPFQDDSASVQVTFAEPFADQTLYTLHVSGVQDRHGNTLQDGRISFFTGEPDVPQPGDVVINEVFYDPPSNELEFVEIYNRSDGVFDLADIQISDDRMAPVPASSGRFILGPGGYAVLARNAEALNAAFPGAGALHVTGLPVFNRGGDAAVLWFGSTIIDSMAYTPSWGGQGVSLERIDPNGPSARRQNWASSTDDRGATPGRRNSVFDPDLDPPSVIFVDQTSDTTFAVFFDEPVAEALPHHFSLGGAVPREVSLVASGEAATLVFEQVIDRWNLEITGIQDLAGNVMAAHSKTAARLARPGVLTVNEIMFAPLADRFDNRSDQPPYVELINRSDAPVSVRNLFWTGPEDETGAADTLRLGSGLAAVPPGGFVVIVAERDVVEDYATQSMLARAFPEIDLGAPEIILLSLTRATLGIRRTSDLIRLHAPDGTLLEEVAYDVAWHHPDLLSTTGISLERISLDRPVDAPDNWMSSVAPGGGTPGAPNSVHMPSGTVPDAPGLVIEPEVFSPDGDGFDDVAAIRYTLNGDAGSIRVRIFDAQGRIVRTIEDASVSGRTGTLLWDGLDDARQHLRIGIYVILLESVDVQTGRTESYKRPVVLARRLQ